MTDGPHGDDICVANVDLPLAGCPTHDKAKGGQPHLIQMAIDVQCRRCKNGCYQRCSRDKTDRDYVEPQRLMPIQAVPPIRLLPYNSSNHASIPLQDHTGVYFRTIMSSARFSDCSATFFY